METPVVFLIFNRPRETELVFGEIARAKPRKLLIVADGPRADRPEELKRCSEARKVLDRVDWDCEIRKNYSDVNLGCKDRVSTGLIWAFKEVEEAIILEDDTLPHSTFFRFCEELLEKYRKDERVMHISGNNFLMGRRVGPYSYYFSRYNHIWGWATWRRAFEFYDYKMNMWPELRKTSWLSDVLGEAKAAEWWKRYFDVAHKGDRMLYDSWDCQWFFSILSQNGLCITPSVNLTYNIGFKGDGTHTKTSDHPLSDLKIEEMIFPLKHPPYMIRYKEGDDVAFEQACQPEEREKREGQEIGFLRKLYLSTPNSVRRLLGPVIKGYRISRSTLKELLRAIARMARVTKNILFKKINRSDYKRWSNPEKLETWWEGRTEVIARMIPKDSRVLEFGAGRRQLEKYLNGSCDYIPSDLVTRGPETIVCDLNKRPLPDLRDVKADIAVFAGVLEYIRDLESMIEWLSKQVPCCVVSYAYISPHTGFSRKIRERLYRLYYGYMNDYTEDELLELFKKWGFVKDAENTWTSQRIYRFQNGRTEAVLTGQGK
jgi:hypothetical protein